MADGNGGHGSPCKVCNMLNFKWRALVCLAALLFSVQALHVNAGSTGADEPVCPFTYEEHSLDDIRSGAKRPYLFGGIYNQTKRDCINCKRAGLWANWCSFTPSDRAPFWDNQLCSSTTADAVIKRVLGQNNHDLLSMTPCDMWRYMRGRTTWVIGDSMSKDMYKALKCFLIEFSDLRMYHATNNFTAMHLLDSVPGKGEPHCMHMPQKTRLCQIHAIQGDLFIEGNRTKIGVLPLLQETLAHPTDIFIVNFGLWHGETRQPEYKENLHQLGKFYSKTRSRFPNLFWLETPKQHFDDADGDYKVAWIGKRKGPWKCQPIEGLSMDKDGKLQAEEGNAVADYVMKGSWRNIIARDILVKEYKVPLIPVYNTTATAWEFHRKNFDGQECSHFCHPSIPQLWLWTLMQSWRQYGVKPIPPGKEVKRYKPGCAIVMERDEGQYGGAKPIELVLKEKQQQLQKQQDQQQPVGFVGWLFGWKRKAPKVPMPRVQTLDGVAVFPATDGGSSSSISDDTGSSPGPFPHAKTLHPWQVLERMYEGQKERLEQRHRRQQREAPAMQGNR